MSEGCSRSFGLLLLLSAALTACSRQAATPTAVASDPVRFEAEAGTLSPLAPQDLAKPRSGGKVISDPNASSAQAVILPSTNDAVQFKLPANFTPGRYTVKVVGRGEFYRGWPNLALENDRRGRMSVTTLDTPSYGERGFGQFDLRPNQVMSISFLNDRYDGPGRDRNAVVDYLALEPVAAPPTGYAIQFGSSRTDFGGDVAVDAADNAWVVGTTEGVLPGQTGGGGRSDIFLRRMDARGREVWTRQFGTPTYDEGRGVALDAAGNSYVVGAVAGALPGQTNQGSYDAFVRKYDAGGGEVWTRQFGGAGGEELNNVALDAAGNVYVVGSTQRVLSQGGLEPAKGLVRKYTPDGTEVWTRYSTPDEASGMGAVTVDAGGNVYVAGFTNGAYPGLTKTGDTDVFVSRYTPAGELIWTRQFGRKGIDLAAASDLGVDPAGNLYVLGLLMQSIQYGSPDNLISSLRKYRPDGTELWTRRASRAVMGVGPSGDVSLLGTSEGGDGLAVLRYAPDGTLVQKQYLVTTAVTTPYGLTIGRSGNIFGTGLVADTLPGATGAGGWDAFVIKAFPE